MKRADLRLYGKIVVVFTTTITLIYGVDPALVPLLLGLLRSF